MTDPVAGPDINGVYHPDITNTFPFNATCTVTGQDADPGTSHWVAQLYICGNAACQPGTNDAGGWSIATPNPSAQPSGLLYSQDASECMPDRAAGLCSAG